MKGSVTDIYINCIKTNKKFPLTHRSMSRFFSISEDFSDFLINIVSKSKGGEIFIPKLSSILIEDLIKSIVMIHSGQQIKESKVRLIGVRQNEKLFEELLNQTELKKAVDEGSHFVILPEDECEIDTPLSINHFKSNLATTLNVDEISVFLMRSSFFSNALKP